MPARTQLCACLTKVTIFWVKSLSNGTATTSIRDLARTKSKETQEGIQIHSAWLENLGRTLLKFRWPLLFLGHTVVFVLALWAAFCLRFDFAVSDEYVARFWLALPAVVGAKLIVFSALKSFHGWWRHVTFLDLIALGRAVVISFFAVTAIDYFFSFVSIPRSITILDAICTAVLVGLARSSWRIAREGLWPGVRLPKGCQGALMVSNSHQTVMLANQINATTNANYRVVGLLTDDEDVIGSTRAGIPLLGKPEDARLLAARHNAAEIWAVAGGLPGQRLRELKDQLQGTELNIKIIPPVLSTANDNGQIPIRDIDIRDLLQREPVVLDTDRLSEQLRGRRIMVTGAGGSIGSEICRQIMRFNPSELVLVDHRENSVFLIHQELQSRSEKREARSENTVVVRSAERIEAEASGENNTERNEHPSLASRFSPLEAQRSESAPPILYPCVADILDEPRMRALFDEYRPEYVYHAAAHKHVGLMECNAGQAIKNNIFGTKTVADLANEFNAKKFVLISTDKAVNPTSVMGVTKQIAERYINALASGGARSEKRETSEASGEKRETRSENTTEQNEHPSLASRLSPLEAQRSESAPPILASRLSPLEAQRSQTSSATPTKFIAVRFGNVLGSNGSVVPIFKKQIAQGGPITVTDERMTRFFMTIPEASQLVLQAASMGKGGEIFVLEMGEQVLIIELARELIRLAGLPQHAIDIQIVGMRPGEKLFEELYFDEEEMLETDHSMVRAAYHRDYSVEEVLAAIDELKPYIGRSNADVRAKLKEIVPEFNWNPGEQGEARNEKREAREEKREARDEQRETRSERRETSDESNEPHFTLPSGGSEP